jgi:hypothetical protein
LTVADKQQDLPEFALQLDGHAYNPEAVRMLIPTLLLICFTLTVHLTA